MFYAENNELLVIGLNTVILLSAYLLIYPKFAGSNLKKFLPLGRFDLTKPLLYRLLFAVIQTTPHGLNRMRAPLRVARFAEGYCCP